MEPKSTGIDVVGIPWYKREEFVTLQALFVGRDDLHDTYDQWLAAVEKLERDLKDERIRVIRVMIDPKEFPDWCMRNDMQPDARARSKYAAEQAHLRVNPKRRS